MIKAPQLTHLRAMKQAARAMEQLSHHHYVRWQKLCIWTAAGKQAAARFFLRHPDVSPDGVLNVTSHVWKFCDGYSAGLQDLLLDKHKACTIILEVNSIFDVDADSGQFNILLAAAERGHADTSSWDGLHVAEPIDGDAL